MRITEPPSRQRPSSGVRNPEVGIPRHRRRSRASVPATVSRRRHTRLHEHGVTTLHVLDYGDVMVPELGKLTTRPRASIRRWNAPSPTRLWRTVSAHWRLARPTDNAFAFVGTVLGANLAGLPQASWSIVCAVASSNALLSAASMMVNDGHDVAEDVVNRPDRPVPSGEVPRRRALALGALFFAAGMVVAAAAGWRFGLAALGVTGLSVLYTWELKSIPFLGNGTTALLSAYPLWCWIAIQGLHGRTYLGAAAGFFVAGVGREMIRTVLDVAGDTSEGIRTVATAWGEAFANRFGLLLILVGLVGAWLSADGVDRPAYAKTLAVSTAVMLVAGSYHLYELPCRPASRRLTKLARITSAMLALGVAWDLITRGWLLHR